MERTYPLSPRSSRDLRIGDYWTVPLSDGTFGCLLVTDLKQSGPGSLKTLVAGGGDWGGAAPPGGTALFRRRGVEQGLTPNPAVPPGGSTVISHKTAKVRRSALCADF